MKNLQTYEEFLNESSINEAAGTLDSFLTKNGWKETKNKSIAAHKGGNIRHFDYANAKNPEVMIRIVDSPSNGVYLELYKDDSQENPMDLKNAIRTPEDLIKGASKYLGVKLHEDLINEAYDFNKIAMDYKDNPYGIGASRVQIVGGDSNYEKGHRIIQFNCEDAAQREKVMKKLKDLGAPAKKITKTMQDKGYMYRYQVNLFESESIESESNEIV